jgi:hypothetical protein
VSCAANGKPRKEVLGPCPLFGKGKLAAAAPGEEEEEVGKGGVKSEKGTGKAKGVKAEKVAKGVKSEKKGVVKAEEVKHEHDLHYGLVKFEEPVQEEDAVSSEGPVCCLLSACINPLSIACCLLPAACCLLPAVYCPARKPCAYR